MSDVSRQKPTDRPPTFRRVSRPTSDISPLWPEPATAQDTPIASRIGYRDRVPGHSFFARSLPHEALMSLIRRAAITALVASIPALALSAQARSARPAATGAVRVGPEKGTVIVVGGGAMGPEIYKAFIDAAGGPDALILDVPNAGGGDSVSPATGQGWRNNGAKNVAVLFTKNRNLADSDSFVALIRQARGVWFEGGRQFHIVEDYGGTKTETEIMKLLERGGVIGGSSAGASILRGFFVGGRAAQ